MKVFHAGNIRPLVINNRSFRSFIPMTHFGSLQIAKKVGRDKIHYNEAKADDLFIYECEITGDEQAFDVEDPGASNASGLARAVVLEARKGRGSETFSLSEAEELQRLVKTEAIKLRSFHEDFQNELSLRLRLIVSDWLMERNIRILRYINKVEGSGFDNLSWIVVDPELISKVTLRSYEGRN